MEWNKKVDLIRLSNAGKFDDFKDFVIQNISSFDNQAWDMFFTAVEIIQEKVEMHKEFYRQVWRIYKSKEMDIEMGFRAEIRAGFLESMIENTNP